MVQSGLLLRSQSHRLTLHLPGTFKGNRPLCLLITTSTGSLIHTPARGLASTVTPGSCSRPRQPARTSLAPCGGPGLSDRLFDIDSLFFRYVATVDADRLCKYAYVSVVQPGLFCTVKIFAMTTDSVWRPWPQ